MPACCAPAARSKACISCGSGLRRLEVALKSFGEAFEQPWLEELRGRAKVLSSRLGPARDLDVFLERIAGRARQGFSGDDEREMFARLARPMPKRRATRPGSRPAPASPARISRVFLDDVAGLAQSRLPLAHGHRLTPMARRMLDRQAARAQQARPRGAQP